MLTYIFSSAVLKERVDGAHVRACSTGILDKEMQATDRVDDHGIVYDAWLVNPIQVLNRIVAAGKVIHTTVLSVITVKAVDSIRVLAQTTYASHKQDLCHGDLD